MTNPPAQQNKRLTALLAGLLAGLLIVLVVGGLALLAWRGQDTQGTTTTALATASPYVVPPATVQAVGMVGTTTSAATPLRVVATPTNAPTAPITPSSTNIPTVGPSPTAALPLTNTSIPQSTPAPTATFAPTSAVPAAAVQSKQTLDAARVPLRDLYSIIPRLKLKTGQPVPHTVSASAGNYKAGHSEQFYMSDILARRYYTITATVHDVTDHVYWYVQNGQQISDASVRKMAGDFEAKIYPTDHRLFGTEWIPGVDNDPHLTVLFAVIPGAGGYYASADEYTRLINPYSNQREIIYINSDEGVNAAEGTLAHEFQHMIHWHENPGHDVWLNEGSSMLAQILNGYDAGGVDADFMAHPNVQLNAWQSSPDAARANYGAAMLFLDFLRDHYGGDKAIQAVVAAHGQGADAIGNALSTLGSEDNFTGVFQKWALANLLDGQPGATQAGLDYPDRQVQVSPQVEVSAYPKSLADTVPQFGAEYIRLDPPKGADTLSVDFSGTPTTRVIDAPAHRGNSLWWSNRGDLADPTMTRSFDLRAVKSATLQFYTWFDLEPDLDYAYAEVSTDNGTTWTTLKGTHTTATDPNGNNLGNAYTGTSKGKQGADKAGWLQERIDLTPYPGKQVLVRFEYITDDGYNAGGFAVDDISVPELGYTDDAEADTGWQAQGFVRVANELPQTYYLAVVKYKQSGFDIQPVTVDLTGHSAFDITGLGSSGPYTSAVLVLAGTTNHTILPAQYQLDVKGR